MNTPPPTITLHASCVAIGARAVLILGRSGAGKSALALQMIALGARLVADDRTILTAVPEGLIATAPETIRGLIEARFVGLLRADPCDAAPVALAVDLDQAETERLPTRRETRFLEHPVPLLHRVDRPYFASAILIHLTHGRAE
ncbi:HPr kinase/phosphorylase [Rhodovulum steppense]|uniref:Hpr(Ser) kinase/phosphatase n=1 Tax=Rhodovulum steppense TaxID=540251 RepID=A0A4R1Z060_9RHOB|nr:HPr kinase/phosphatase C-terminal domain-containing protein [Rhodovulum steppense]TCM86939.1 Hpr(Ser) kinase/phosphatase [Rhodovulum steppense]